MLIAAALILGATVWYGVLSAHLGHQPDARPWLRWPLVVHGQVVTAVRGLFIKKRPAVETKADHVKIAELEYELFGIEPKPGTTAASAINARHAFKPDNH